MSQKIIPLNGYVALRPYEEEEQMYGNIVLPDLGKEKPEMGVVAATAPTYNWHKGEELPSALKEGDLVLIPKLGSMKISVNGEDYYITKETEILAKLS